jgi:hypothetical protein
MPDFHPEKPPEISVQRIKRTRSIPDALLKQRLFGVPDENRLAIFMCYARTPNRGSVGCFYEKTDSLKKEHTIYPGI